MTETHDSYIFEQDRIFGAFKCYAEADVSPYTTNAFRRVVSSLPTPYDAEIVATRAAYEQFFGQWGPYYVKQLGAGGAVRISMNVESSLVDTESHTTAEIEAQIGASYSLWSAGAHASQTSSRTHISDEVTEGTHSSFTVVGGDVSEGFSLADWSPADFQRWSGSVKEAPGAAIQMVIAGIENAIEPGSAHYNAVIVARSDIYGLGLSSTVRRALQTTIPTTMPTGFYDSGWFRLGRDQIIDNSHNLGAVPRLSEIHGAIDDHGSETYVIDGIYYSGDGGV